MKKRESGSPIPPLPVYRPVPDSVSCFCAGVVWRMHENRIQYAWVPYKMNGTGMYQVKLAGGMWKKGESPVNTIRRELEEELGVEIKPEEAEYIYGVLEDCRMHVKLFFLITAPKRELRQDAYDAETGKPEWSGDVEWLEKNLFGMHQTAFRYAKERLAAYIKAEECMAHLVAAVMSGLIAPDNRIKGLLRQRALKDPDFFMRYAEELVEIEAA